ncbi:MAG TPA: hypothetical protein PLA68_16740, partial [Panacibacter sp.]|nr:hypothetical protein [Panacibacter sp.]
MAINKNHEFEELDGVKCAIVEKNATAGRVAFLKNILDYNRYTVVVVPTPAPKAAPAKAAASAVETTLPETLVAPAIETFTIGVTDVTFNPTNAIFGRLLKAPKGHIVTLAYWQQKEN